MALTEMWLSNEDSKNKHVIDQCVAHGYTLHHSPRTSGRRGGGVGILVKQCNQGDFQTDPCKSSDYFIRIDGGCSYYLFYISTSHCNIPHASSKINGLKTGTFYEEFSEYVEKLSCASGKVQICMYLILSVITEHYMYL